MDTLTWKHLPTLPHPVSVGGVSTDGDQLYVIGTHQDDKNGISGAHVALALDPIAGWEELPTVPISGQASTVAWVGQDNLVAWNYTGQTAMFDGSGWTLGPELGDFGECYPTAANTSTEKARVITSCYRPVAVYDAASNTWTVVPQDTAVPWEKPAWYGVTDDQITGILKLDSDRILILRYSLSG